MQENQRFHALDSLRGIGALFVLTIHCLQFLGISDWFRHTPFRLLVNGRSLVMFFFVLSGFVLTYGLVNSRQKNNFWLYLKRRTARIYLPYAGTGVMCIFCSFLPNWPMMGDIPGYFMFTGTPESLAPNPLTWSLVYEFRISLLIPFMCWLAWNYERAMCAAMIVLFIVQTYFMFSLRVGLEPHMVFADTPAGWWKMWITQLPYGSHTLAGTTVLTVRYFICIYIGIWLAKCIIEKRAWIDRVQGIWVPVMGLAAFVLMGLLLDEAGTLGAVFIVILVFRSPRFRWFLDTKFMMWLGRISYSLYLTHFIILTLGWTYLPVHDDVLRVTISSVICFVYAEFYNRFVEVPATKLSRSMK